MPVDKEEMMRFCLSVKEQQPDITKDELEKLVLAHFYEETPPLPERPQPSEEGEPAAAVAAETPSAAPEEPALAEPFLPEAPAAATVAPPVIPWWQRWQQAGHWGRLARWTSGTLVLLALFAGMAYYSEPDLQRKIDAQLGLAPKLEEPSEIEGQLYSPQELVAYRQQVAREIQLDGLEKFSNKRIFDMANDAEIVVASIRLAHMETGQEAQHRQRILEFMRQQKLTMACLVREKPKGLPPGETAVYERLTGKVADADKHIDALYRAYVKDDVPGMLKAMEKIRKIYYSTVPRKVKSA